MNFLTKEELKKISNMLNENINGKLNKLIDKYMNLYNVNISDLVKKGLSKELLVDLLYLDLKAKQENIEKTLSSFFKNFRYCDNFNDCIKLIFFVNNIINNVNDSFNKVKDCIYLGYDWEDIIEKMYRDCDYKCKNLLSFIISTNRRAEDFLAWRGLFIEGNYDSYIISGKVYYLLYDC